jgi:1-phosphofructokinase family hexose kinase
MVITVTLNPAVDKVLVVPGFRVGAHARARVRSIQAAGKGVNVARGLARLGGSPAASGFVGENEERMFVESLADEGVQARFCTVSRPTRTNTTVLDPEERTTTHLREEGFDISAADRDRLSEMLTTWLSGREATVVFAGSLPPGVEPDHFAALIGRCRQAGAEIVVDTSGPALRAAYGTGQVSVLKPNLLELGQLLGEEVAEEDAAEAARGLFKQGGELRIVLLTLGVRGAWLITPEDAVGRRCPLDAEELRNTVGCGDAFLAGWLRGRQVSGEGAGALEWAVAAGTASAAKETTVGYTLEDVRAFREGCHPIG